MAINLNLISALDNLKNNIIDISERETLSNPQKKRLNEQAPMSWGSNLHKRSFNAKRKIIPMIDKLKTLNCLSTEYKNLIADICNDANELSMYIAKKYIRHPDDEILKPIAHVPLFKYIEILTYYYKEWTESPPTPADKDGDEEDPKDGDEEVNIAPLNFLITTFENATDAYSYLLKLDDMENEELDNEMDKLIQTKDLMIRCCIEFEMKLSTTDIIKLGTIALQPKSDADDQRRPEEEQHPNSKDIIKIYTTLIQLLQFSIDQFEKVHKIVGDILDKSPLSNVKLDYVKYIYYSIYEPQPLIDYMKRCINNYKAPQ
jgi:hypothetical protein